MNVAIKHHPLCHWEKRKSKTWTFKLGYKKELFPPENQSREMVEIVKISRLEILFTYAVTYETICICTHELRRQVYRYVTL